MSQKVMIINKIARVGGFSGAGVINTPPYDGGSGYYSFPVPRLLDNKHGGQGGRLAMTVFCPLFPFDRPAFHGLEQLFLTYSYPQ